MHLTTDMNGISASWCVGGGSIGLERTRYFARQIVGPDDLTQDQIWIRDKLRRHNRLLHGWGVVCGAFVREGDAPCQLVVEPGYILGPYGDEIVIDREVVIDACLVDPDGNATGPCGDVDPWCSPVRVTRPADAPLYLAVRYDECETRPVRAHGCGCGCDDVGCEYSRVRDSFALKLLTELPAAYTDMTPPPLTAAFSCETRRNCPPCPSEPWVILADVTVGDTEIVQLDCVKHRRVVVTFAQNFIPCGPVTTSARPTAKNLPVYKEAVVPGSTNSVITDPVMVSARRADHSWTLIPVTAEVSAGDTIGDVIREHGDRRISEAPGGESFSLRELVIASGLDADEPVASTAELASKLEAIDLGRVTAMRVARARVDALVDKSGTDVLDAELATPDAASALPVTALRGIGPDSTVGARLSSLSVSELAAGDLEKLAATALKGLKGREREAARRQLEEVRVTAIQVTRVGQAWTTG
jgi:hypothetical protein